MVWEVGGRGQGRKGRLITQSPVPSHQSPVTNHQSPIPFVFEKGENCQLIA
ncbi:MAG: hypothetical protein ACKPBB_23310 [Sphaerospermopsis kisseleviana]